MKSLNGIFIHATEEQLSDIWAAVAREGFTQDSAGVLELLMLAVDPPEDDEEAEEVQAPDPVRAVMDHLAANPEQAAALKAAAANVFGAVMGKFKKPGV